jgi:hypothetical protein
MKQRGWRYIAAVVVAGALLLSMPAKPVLAQVGPCNSCSCTPPPASLNCDKPPGDTCSSDADCAGSATCNDEGLCQGGGGGGSTYQCPAGSTMVCPETTVICGVSANNQTYITQTCNAGLSRLAWNHTAGCGCGWVSEWICGTKPNGDPKWCFGSSWQCLWVSSCFACTCQPNCAPTAPTGFSVQAPDDGLDFATTSVPLLWNIPTSWGTSCAGTRQYQLYVGTTNPPTTLYSTETEGVTTKTFTGTRGTTYYWYVVASNGQLSTSSTPVRSFTILNNQITGTVFYDVNNNCGGTGKSGVSVSLVSK